MDNSIPWGVRHKTEAPEIVVFGKYGRVWKRRQRSIKKDAQIRKRCNQKQSSRAAISHTSEAVGQKANIMTGVKGQRATTLETLRQLPCAHKSRQMEYGYVQQRLDVQKHGGRMTE
uniref:Transposase n=1 Tax=Steinernema glaseri TaxID=37863 RepID=A0A1I7ZVB4_9BILA